MSALSYIHHSWQDSSGRVTSPSQRPLHDNTQHSKQTSMPPAGFEPAIPISDRPQNHALDYGYVGARNDTTRPSGQTPDKEVEIKNITVYVSGYTETDTTGMLSPPTVWRQQIEFVSSRQSGQILAAVLKGFECRCNGQNSCRFKCRGNFPWE